MTKTLSASRDESDFAACAAAAEAGDEVIILRDSKPAAGLVALTTSASPDHKPRALPRLQRMQAEGWTPGPGPFDRDSLHER
jgi:antitoxin (DNA-binding transcriptional repressor) of toxin-antitoxin stability system